MKKFISSFSGLILFAFMLMANATETDNPLIGTWSFNVSQAPWEYSRGKVVFEKDKNDILAGKIIFSSGAELAIPRITVKDNRLTFEVIIDGYSTKTTATIKDDCLSGYVETYEGNMPFSANKNVPED